MAADKVFTTRNFEGERRAIPLPIQTYFWRQTSQLLKPKLVRRNYESACISFERIICENRIQDLQPSLASAVKSINRWHLIQSSVPYILQCCSLLLSNRGRLGNIDRLGNAERELLYTLHWILLEGPRVCCVVDTDSLLYPLTTIEQFVHELTPHVHRMRESDLTFRLENGVAIWGPLWKHEKPLITPFTCEVITKDTDPEDDGSNISAGQSSPKSAVQSDPEFSAATFFDVAVLKCLLTTGWNENGVVWALRYLAAYLKREFNLPDQAVSKEPSGELQVDIPVLGSSVESLNQDTKTDDGAVKSDMPGEDNTKPDGKDVIKITDADAQNLESGDSTVCACQIEDEAESGTRNNQESLIPENVLLAVPDSTVTDSGDRSIHGHGDHAGESPTVDHDAGSASDVLDEERLPAQGLERSGSIKFRIRVQSSPGVSPGGRVLTAVASPTGSAATQNELNNASDNNSQDLGNDGTIQNPKVYIKPSNTLQVPLVSTDNTNRQNDRGPLLNEAETIKTTSNDVSTDKFTSEVPLEVHPSDSVFLSPDEKVVTVPEGNKQAVSVSGQMNASSQKLKSCGAFESMVSYECEVQNFQTRVENGATGELRDSSLYKRLSEHASSSSMESESQPLLKPSPLTAPDVKPVTILGSLDSPRGSINRDSFARTDRYFVFPGAADFITTDGRLSSLMILQALNSIVRENPTSLICDATLTLLQQLVTVHEDKKSKKRGSSIEVDDRTVAETQAVGFRSPHSDNILGRIRASFYGKPPSFLGLAMGCLFSLFKAMGCPLGCGEGCRGITGDRLRNLANKLLSQLFRSDEAAFKMWLQQFARLEPHEDLVDFLHALLGFCEEDQEQSDDEMADAPKSEKRTRRKSLFSLPEGVNGVIIGSIFKILISRVAEMNFFDLKNLTFYGELRQLLRFVKESYGGVFWKVALSGLLDSAYKESKDQADATKTPEQESVSKGRWTTVQKRAIGRTKVERTATYKAKRIFLQKFARVTMERSDSNASLSHNPKLPAGANSNTLETALSPRSKRKIFTLGTWRKQKAVGTPYDSDEDLLDSSEALSEQQSSTGKRKLLKSRASTRKKLDDVFSMARKGDGLLGSFTEPSQPIDIIVHEFETKPVHIEALRAGMVRFRFFLHGSQPGSVPDPKILASMLDLEAPAVARACLLLECCILVHKCNQGEWPQWLRGSLPSLAHRRGGHSPTSPTPFMFAQRRNLVAMHEAGTLFRAWGVALGKKLEQVLAKKRRKMLPSIEEEDGKPIVTDEEDVEEDFLDEATLSESAKVCPYPLLMIACQLLLEITAFLRESHGLYSVSKPVQRPLHRFVAPRRRQSVSSRRRSTAFSPELQQRRLSSIIGGGGERIRRASVMSQSSIVTDFPSSPSRALQEPPTITVSGTDQDSSKLDAGHEEKRERKDSIERARNRQSLYYPRVSAQHSPKTVKRIAKRSAIGGEGDAVRFRSKSTRCDAKHLSVDALMLDEEDESDDEDPTLNLPWLSAVIQLNSQTAFLCDHQGVCPVNCHQRQSRSCTRMIRALKTVYSSLNKQDKVADKPMSRGRSSPLISAPQLGTAEQTSKKNKEDEDMIKYISSSIASLTHCPFSVIAKAGTVIDTAHLMETLPVVWELLLDEDQQLVSSAAAVFLLTGIRLRDTVEQMLHKELICPDANERVKSLQRFEVLWQSRYHAWPRLEEGARILLKVPPPKIDFTLPSPTVGVPLGHPPDCPWDPRLILEEQQDKKKQDKKKVRDNGSALKKQKERSEFLLRAVPVSMEATVGMNVAEDEKAECADMWYKLSKDEKEKHIHVMRVYLLSPFLFGQVYQEDKWINWAYECKLLPSKTSFETKALKDEHFDAVDLVETAFNKLAENVLLKNKDGLVKTLDIIGNARMTMSQHLDKAITCAESFLAFTNMRDKIKLKPGISKKQGDVALLLAHNQVSDHIKQLAAGVDPVKKFNERCAKEEDLTADKKKEGNDEFSSGKYMAASSVYTRALHMSPYNHVLYGNRSQSFLKTRELGCALADGRRAVVLKPDWHKAHYRYAQAFYEMGNLTRAKEVNRAACKICSDRKDLESQFEKFEKANGGKGKSTNKKGSKATTTKRKGSASSEPEDLPDLVDPDSSDTSRNNSDDDCVPDLVEMGTSEDSDDSDDEESEDAHSDSGDGYDSDDSAARKKSTSVSGAKKQTPSKKIKQLVRESVQDKDKKEEKVTGKMDEKEKKVAELSAKKELNKPDKKNRKDKAMQIDQNGNSQWLREFNACLKQGSKAFLEKKFDLAVGSYRGAVKELKHHDYQYQIFEMKEIDFVILLYSFGATCLELGGHEELKVAKEQFEIIVVEHKNVVFPLAYLGFGRVFYKQNRFGEALEPLEEGLAIVNKLGEENLAAYRWPCSQVIIDDTKPGKLLSALQTLIRICRHPPRPDAVCRYSDCFNKAPIYLTDPDYKGYIRLICHENCKVDFHPVCWKKQKSTEEGKTGDKDFLDDKCMTPDCLGSVINVQIYDSEGLKTEFKSEKPTAKVEAKPKAPKQNKVKASVAGIKQKKKKEKDDHKIEEEADTVVEEKVVKNPPPPPPLPVQKEEKHFKEDHSHLEKGGYTPSDFNIQGGEGVFIMKKEDDDEATKGLPLKGVGKVKTKKKKLKNTQTLDEFLKDHGGQQTFRPAFGEDGEDLGEIPHPKRKFDLVPPPPGWSQQEMEAPFAIPPHLQGDAAEFEASYRPMDSQMFSFSPSIAPMPTIDLKAVTEYVSTMLQEILRANGALELADPNIMQPLSMLPDSYQDIISNAGGLRPILEQSGKFLFDGNRVMLPEDKEFEDLVKTFKSTQSSNPFLDRTINGSAKNDEAKLQNGIHDCKSIWDNGNIIAEKDDNGGAGDLCCPSLTSPLNPSAKGFVSSSQSDSLTTSASKTSLASDATLMDVELVDDQIEDDKSAIIEQSEQSEKTSNGKTEVESILESDVSSTTKTTVGTQKEANADISNVSATLEVGSSPINGKNFEDSSGDLSQAISAMEPVEKGPVVHVVREETALLVVQSNHKRNISDPVITSKAKAVQTQPNVKSKGVGTEPIPEPFKAEYLRAVAEKDALQARLQENTERHNALLNKNNSEVEKVKKKLADALQEKEKYFKEVHEVKQKNQEEIRKLRQQCEDKDDKIKTLNHKLLQDAQEKSNTVSNLKKELSTCKGQFTSEKDSWNKERAEKDELLKNTKLQHSQQQARAQDAEIKLLELRRDVGLRFLERAYQESHITINNLIQAVNARIAGPKVEELITTWKNYASECHQRVVQCKATFNEQIELLKTGRTLASVPQLTIPGPPPYPAIPVLQSVVPGQQQNQPQPQPPAEVLGSAPRTSEPPTPSTTTGTAAGGTSAVAPPPAPAASVNGDKPPGAGPLPPAAVAAAAAAAAAANADKARPPSNSFEKIMLRLSTMYPNFTRLELTGFIKEVRHNKHGSLTGLSLEDIVASVSGLVEQKKKAGLLRTVAHSNSSPNLQRASIPTVPQKTQPKPVTDASKIGAAGGGNYEEDPCVICHEDMNGSFDVVTLECGHKYHSPCIRKWLMGEQSTCPTCRVHALLPDEFPRLK